jgi:hypothetical protein
MFRLLVLCFTALSLICAIQCTPTAEKRGKPSYGAKRENLVARGRCDFLCPHENPMGMGLDDMYTGSERLYCSYDAEGMSDNNFCVYNRVSFIHKRLSSVVVFTWYLEHRGAFIKLVF